MHKYLRILSKPSEIVFWLGKRTQLVPDKLYLWCAYKHYIGKKLNLRNPITFNEKLQWLKLHDRKPIYSTMVDKYEVKKLVASIIGEKYIIPTIGVWNSFEDINFNCLPKQFVLKCTHDSGGVVICKDKDHFDIESARRKICKLLKRNFYLEGREWPYKDIKPRIIAEKYMEDSKTRELQDYKVHVFNGVPKIVLVCRNRFSEGEMTEDFFDVDWNRLDIQRINHHNSCDSIERPIELDEMVKLSKKLSRHCCFLRCDFYIIDGKVYFGEMTFFPASGFEVFLPDNADRKIGELLDIDLS